MVTMLARDAKRIATEWVLAQATDTPGFHGAFFAGSITTARDDAPFPPWSDIDVKIVLDRKTAPVFPQKVLYRDIVLDVSYATAAELRSPELVLSSYYTAVHFAQPGIILDPTGQLTEVQRTVEREYAARSWVRTRCSHARELFEQSLEWPPSDAPMHEQVFAWLFSLLLSTHVVLVADLRNPTARRCMVESGGVLQRYGHGELHERMLGILGSATMAKDEVEGLLGACANAFDAASSCSRTPFAFDSNLKAFTRPIAINGAREMVVAGFQREAMVWIATIHTWCQTALLLDVPVEDRARLLPLYEEMLDALGVSSPADLAERNRQLRELLPELWRATEEIIAANPSIVDRRRRR
jgi:hypothetical protein